MKSGRRHADYPHQPGTLYDCPTCEATCFCSDNNTCVHCYLTLKYELEGEDL